jgi:hypothetical protein
MRWAENIACIGAIRNGYDILVGKTERKRQLGRPRSRNVIMDNQHVN